MFSKMNYKHSSEVSINIYDSGRTRDDFRRLAKERLDQFYLEQARNRPQLTIDPKLEPDFGDDDDIDLSVSQLQKLMRNIDPLERVEPETSWYSAIAEICQVDIEDVREDPYFWWIVARGCQSDSGVSA